MKTMLLLLMTVVLFSCGGRQPKAVSQPAAPKEEFSKSDMQYIAIHYSEQMVAYYLHDSRYTVSGIMPVKDNGNKEYVVDGLIKPRDGGGANRNYSCKLRLMKGSAKVGPNWKCEQILIDGKEIKL